MNMKLQFFIILVVLAKPFYVLSINVTESKSIGEKSNNSSDLPSPMYEYLVSSSGSTFEKADGVYLPIYSLWLIGISMLIMMIIIIYLSVIIYTAKKYEYDIFKRDDPTNSTFERLDRIDYNRRYSKEIAPIHTSTMFLEENNDFSVNYPMDRFREVSRREVSTSTDTTLISPKIKRNIPTNIISKQRMHEICEEVKNKRQMGKSDSSKELDELLNLIQSFERPVKSNRLRERSSSTPELLDVYDILPAHNSNRPKQESNDIADEKETRTPKVVPKDDLIIPINDSLPVSSSHISIDDDTQYLFPLSGANGEPLYINANRNDFKF